MEPHTHEKKITHSLAKYIDIILQSRDWILAPDEEDARLISLIDKEESLTHVEFDSELNLMTITSAIGGRPQDNFDGAHFKPIIWRKSAWESSLPKFNLRKKQGEDRRQAALIFNERVEKLIKGMIEMSGITDRNIFVEKATEAVKKGNLTKIEAIWGVKL